MSRVSAKKVRKKRTKNKIFARFHENRKNKKSRQIDF